MGDLNLDGVVDGNDIGIIIGLGYYGKGIAPHGWLDGDLNGDGVVNGDDIGLIIGTGTYGNGSYGSKSTTPTLALPRSTGGGNKAATLSGSVADTTTIGVIGDGKMDYVYDPTTVDLQVSYDGDTRITASTPLQRLKLLSAAGHFRTDQLKTSGFGTFTNTPTLLDLTNATGSIPDGYDLGDILPTGLTVNHAPSDLPLTCQVHNA